MPTSAAAHRALLRTCGVVRREDWQGREPALAGLQEEDWRSIARLAAHHGLAGLAARNLEWARERGVEVPSGALDSLEVLRRRVLTQNLARRAAAREVADALAREGIPFVALKGAALAEEVYGDLSLRGFNDFDVLVPVDSVDAAYRVGQKTGYALVRFSDVRDWIRAGAHAAGMVRADGSGFDLHWTVGPDLPEGSPEVVWRHVTPAPQGATLPGLRLSPEMCAVHLAKHFHTGQYCLLKPLVDFHFAARRGLDEALVDRICDELALGPVVEVARTIATRRLGGGDATKSASGLGARLAARVVTDGLLADAAARSRLGNWMRYLAAAGGAGHSAREMARILFPGPLALAIFFNAPFRARMYPAYYWRQLVKVLTLSSK
jgi:hypothetical protein